MPSQQYYNSSPTTTKFAVLSGPENGNNSGIIHYAQINPNQFLSSGLPTLSVYNTISEVRAAWNFVSDEDALEAFNPSNLEEEE